MNKKTKLNLLMEYKIKFITFVLYTILLTAMWTLIFNYLMSDVRVETTNTPTSLWNMVEFTLVFLVPPVIWFDSLKSLFKHYDVLRNVDVYVTDGVTVTIKEIINL